MRLLIPATLLALLGAPLSAQCPDGTPPPCRSATSARRPSAPPSASVAVLTFENLSRDTADAYLVEGLANDISAQLGRLERLTVTSRSVVRRLPEIETMAPQAAGRALNVAYLVTGGIQRGGSRVRVSVELLRASNGQSVWADQFDRTATDLLDVQRDVASAVATGVGGRLSPQEQQAVRSRPAISGEAYDHILRGDFYYAQRNQRSTERAIAEYDAAVRVDPRSALANAKLSQALSLCPDWGWTCSGLPAESLRARGRLMADRALALDPSLGDAWKARAGAIWVASPDSAGEALERAVALSPRDPNALHLKAWYLTYRGQYAAATAQYRGALALDPARAVTYEHLWRVAMIGHRFDEARALIDTAIALEPAFDNALLRRAWLLAHQGDTIGALADLDAAARLDSTLAHGREGLIAYALAMAGDTVVARALVDAALARGRLPANMEWAAFRVGRTDAVFASLSAGTQWSEFWRRMPWYDPVRSDPRFLALIEADRRRWQLP